MNVKWTFQVCVVDSDGYRVAFYDAIGENIFAIANIENNAARMAVYIVSSSGVRSTSEM